MTFIDRTTRRNIHLHAFASWAGKKWGKPFKSAGDDPYRIPREPEK